LTATYFVSRYSALVTARAASRLLDAADRGRGARHHAVVESDHAGLEPLDDAKGRLRLFVKTYPTSPYSVSLAAAIASSSSAIP
jgi:hypothetical protein